jgi:hypothetical protein
MSDTSSLVSGSSSVCDPSDLDTLIEAHNDAHRGYQLHRLRSLLSELGNEDASSCSVEQARTIFSDAATSMVMRDQTQRDLLSFYGENLEDCKEELHDQAESLSIYDSVKYPLSDSTHDKLLELDGQELLEEALRLAVKKQIKHRRMLEDAAEKINDGFKLEGANAITAPEVAPEVPDPKEHLAGDKAKGAEGIIDGDGK